MSKFSLTNQLVIFIVIINIIVQSSCHFSRNRSSIVAGEINSKNIGRIIENHLKKARLRDSEVNKNNKYISEYYQLSSRTKNDNSLYNFNMPTTNLKIAGKILAKLSGKNIVIDKAVEKKIVSLKLNNSTLEHALKVLADNNGLYYYEKNNIINIEKPKLMVKTFHVNYISTIRSGSRSMSGASSSASGGGEDSDTKGGSQGKGSGGEGKGQGSGGGGGSTSVSGKDQANAFSELQMILRTILSSEGKVAINALSGAITIKDYPKNIDEVGHYLQKFEKIMLKQVLIETKIIQVTLNRENRFGINWGLIPSQSSSSVASLFDINYHQNKSSGISSQIKIGPFNAFIDAFSKQGDVEIISSPRILTLNNQKALINVAEQKTIFTEKLVLNNNSTVKSYTPNQINIGVTLDVTPKITKDNQILMNIHPIITGHIGTSKSPSGVEIPTLSVRESDTVIKVQPGKSIVLGGLIQESFNNNTDNIPLLAKIPIIGFLFGQKQKSSNKTELVIMLTPYIQ